MKETRRKMRPISAPRLTDELLDCVLVFRVRLTTATSDADLATNILQPLNALPRSIAPLVNRATLAAKPWIHIESLLEFDDRWLVESLLQLERTPHNHPVQYRWERVVSFAVTRNDVAFLKWWQSKQFPIGSSFNTEQACESGNVSALDWALAASLKLTFTQKSLQLAFARGHALILNWIIRNHKQSHPALAQAIRSADNLALAIAAGHTSVIRWWLSRPFRTIMPIIAEGQVLEDALSTVAPFLPSKQLEPDSSIVALPTLLALLPAKLVKSIFLLSCASGNLESLDASFKQLSLASSATTTTKPVNAPNRNQGMTHLAYLYASAAGHVHVLNWLDKHDFVPITVISPGTAPDSCTEELDREKLARARLRDPSAIHERLLHHFVRNASAWIKVHSAIDIASIMGQIDVLHWWLDMRDVMDPADFEYSALAINTACRQGNARVIEWWIESGLELKYSESSALAVPAALGHVDVLKVWRKYAVHQVKLDPAMLIRAAQNGAVETLEWWASESSPDKVRLAIDGCILTCRNVRVVEWYLNHGGSVKRWTGERNKKIAVELNFDFTAPADALPDTPSSRPHSPAAVMQEQRIKKQVYLSYQRLCQRYPKLTIAPLSPTQIKSLAERGCSAFIKLALTKHPPTDASSPLSIDMDDLSHSDNCTPLIHWLMRSQSALKTTYTPAAIVNATKAGATRVLSWWADHFPAFTFKTSPELDAYVKGNQIDAKTAAWWTKHSGRVSKVPVSLWARPKPVVVPVKPLPKRKKLRPRTMSGSKSLAASANSVDGLTPLVAALTISAPLTIAPVAM